jgi:hypothetical protein
MIAETILELTGQMELMAETTEWMLQITEEELLPLLAEGIGSGFAIGTIFALLALGIYKAIGLLNINHR